ncbi:MAG: hypothetical protein OEY28_14020 [Nitrospira sp.]|nr:hypothetical protein [Nitrospira sp.]
MGGKTVVVLLFVALLAGCGSGGAGASGPDDLKKLAEPAEYNLKTILEAAKAYHAKHNKPAEYIDELAQFGADHRNFKQSEYYSIEFGYGLYQFEFDNDGKIVKGWVIATPEAGKKALTIRLNAVNGEFDYTQPGEEMKRLEQNATGQ